jgi:hypothetical protein
MNEIVRGNLRTPDQIASFVVQKLQQKFPNGPQDPSSLTKRNVAVPPPPVTVASIDSSSGGSGGGVSNGIRKPLRHPTNNLLIGGMNSPPTAATPSTVTTPESVGTVATPPTVTTPES